MTAIAWALIVIGIGAMIEGWHGKTIWSDLVDFFEGKSTSTNNPQQSGAQG